MREIFDISGRASYQQDRVSKKKLMVFINKGALHLALDVDKETLAERIDRRCVAMVEAGLIGEVRALRSRGYDAKLRPMQAIGYRHIQPVVDGADTLANATEAMQRDTRRFAKRQRTWLRAVPEVEWVDPEGRDEIHARVGRFLEAQG